MRGKRRLFRAVAAGLAVAAVAAMAAWHRFSPLRIGLYDLEQADAGAIRSLLGAGAAGNIGRASVVELDPGESLESSLARRLRPDLVITYAGAALDGAAARFAPLPDALAGRIPPAIRDAAAQGGRRFALPLQADHFELAFRAERLAGRRIAAPASLAELESVARALAAAHDWPIFVAGGDDLSLLLLVSALVESEGGGSASKALAGALAGATSLDGALDAPLPGRTGETSLRGILDGLVRWRDEGLLHSEWYRMRGADLGAFMERGMAPLVLMPLSLHRTLPSREIRAYGSSAFPPGRGGAMRSLAAPLMVAAVVERSPRRARALEALTFLVGLEAQKRLCDRTGLAPAVASAEALDKQASDARLWIAASLGALPDAGRASKATGTARADLAREIRRYLEAGGTGFPVPR